MERTGKSYTVKKWFADKVAQEMRRNINMCDVFAIVKESEKAVYAMCGFRKAPWSRTRLARTRAVKCITKRLKPTITRRSKSLRNIGIRLDEKRILEESEE